MIEVNGKKYRCQIEYAVSLFSGKWKVDIVCLLKLKGVLRFNELKRRLPRITHKILAEQLNELEQSKLIDRKVYPEVPPRVEYRLTASGEELYIIFDQLIQWANSHIKIVREGDNTATEELP